MTNCEWFSSKLEAYFCDGLSSEELQRCQTHLASCAECSGQVESLKDIDPLVRGVLQRRLALARLAAQTNTRPRLLKLALAGASMAVAVVILSFGMMYMQKAPEPDIAATGRPEIPQPVQPAVKKDDAVESSKLAKPNEGSPVVPAPQPHLDSPVENGPEFAIADAAGYTTTLETYRGRILLFGVVSPEQKTALANLQQLFDTFGANRGIRILGVSRRREDTLVGATLPLFFNHGSKLLGVRDGQFLLIDAEGKPRLGGSLSDAANLAQLKNQLGQMGIR